MTRKQKRLAVILGGLLFLALAAGMTAYALSQKIAYFYSPSDLAETTVAPGQRFRIGGIVERGSVLRGQHTQVSFAVTDMGATVPVRFTGILPDLFREGQGVIAEGSLTPEGVFMADTVLAKHDENYMPREVADSLKERGVWKEGEPLP
ncbi:cytochrome c maturation protein CcmE [Limoniibacter endophyticus]|uniref:Cytochrome c-type biogenesis protein CcmE n=1 Tax=Limoniibacter endophyticus TaxID=1565040 RepID=A0A8J3GFW3_9HYPH|nr:cytochrome c maturation protein CcmE [Limoniibacter endophyticus]GHC69258.1 cytochrome c-type biogenesis protein CcmE [Limoniibacter endophyticus]